MVLKLHLSKNDAIVVLVNGAVIIKTVPNPVASAAYAFIYNDSPLVDNLVQSSLWMLFFVYWLLLSLFLHSPRIAEGA